MPFGLVLVAISRLFIQDLVLLHIAVQVSIRQLFVCRVHSKLFNQGTPFFYVVAIPKKHQNIEAIR